MNRSIRYAAFALLLAIPAVAQARPPLIYHHVDQVPAHAGGAVRLRLSSHDVVVRIETGDTVSVTTDIWSSTDSDSDKEALIKRHAPAVWTEGNDIEVGPPNHHDWGWHIGWERSYAARVTIEMPAGMKIDYGLGSGDFRFDNPGAKTAVDGESGSGDVYFRGDPARLHLRAGSGDMHIATGADSGSVSVRTGSGDVAFNGNATSLALGAGSGNVTVNDGVARSVVLHSGSGDIVAHWKKLGAGATFMSKSGSGDVVMYFPASTVIGGKISTGSGDVNTDFPASIHGSHHSYALSGGPGGITVDLDTGSGDIDLRKGG